MKGNLYRKIGKKAWATCKADYKVLKKERKYKYRNYFKVLTN